jgi:hypothetical protein
MKNSSMLKVGKLSEITKLGTFQGPDDDAAISIRTLNDPKVRAAFDNNWDLMWSNFIADPNNTRWWETRCTSKGPNYCLPMEFIQSLSAKTSAVQAAARHYSGRKTRVVSKRALISADDAKAETAFREICQRYSPSCVGEWNGHPLLHELLGPFTSYDTFSDALLMQVTFLKGTLEQRKKKLRSLDPVSTRIQRILRHRAGQLFAEEKFVEELCDLRAAWTRQRSTIPFPLTRHVIDRVSVGQAAKPIHPRTVAFLTQVRKFLDRWELTALCTWDLITPLGPIAGLPVRVNLNALGDILISRVYPSYWPATDIEEHLFARLQSSTSAGMEPIQERLLDKPSIFERAYELRIVEQAFRTRYAPTPHGYVERLIQAFQTRFSLDSRLRIQQIRSKYESSLQ